MKKKSDKSKILKNSAIMISATILEKVLFFVINVLIARYLQLDQYGEYTTALEFATFFSVFTNIGVNQALIRAINLESRYENEHFTNNLILKTILAMAVYILLTGSLFFTNYNANTIHLALIFGFVRIGNEFLLSFYSLNEAKEQFSVQAIFSSLFSFSFLASTAIIIALKGNYFHFAWVRSILVIFFMAIISIHVIKSYKLKFNFEKLSTFVKDTVPFTLAIIYSNLIQRTNIIILSLMHGTLYSGIFNNAYLFYISLFFVPYNLQRVLLPYLYKLPYKTNKMKFQFAFNVFSKFLAVISFYILIIFLLFSKEIITLIFGTKYTGSINILKILSLGIPFIFSIIPSIITALDKQMIVSYINGIGVIINIIANFILIYFFKSEGAAIATVITAFFIFILRHLYLKIKRYVKLFETFMVYAKLIIITCAICTFQLFLIRNIFFIYSLLIISSLYFGIIFAWIFTKNDIRVIKEAFGVAKK